MQGNSQARGEGYNTPQGLTNPGAPQIQERIDAVPADYRIQEQLIEVLIVGSKKAPQEDLLFQAMHTPPLINNEVTPYDVELQNKRLKSAYKAFDTVNTSPQGEAQIAQNLTLAEVKDKPLHTPFTSRNGNESKVICAEIVDKLNGLPAFNYLHAGIALRDPQINSMGEGMLISAIGYYLGTNVADFERNRATVFAQYVEALKQSKVPEDQALAITEREVNEIRSQLYGPLTCKYYDQYLKFKKDAENFRAQNTSLAASALSQLHRLRTAFVQRVLPPAQQSAPPSEISNVLQPGLAASTLRSENIQRNVPERRSSDERLKNIQTAMICERGYTGHAHNEDRAFVSPNGQFAFVADGLSQGGGGEVASSFMQHFLIDAYNSFMYQKEQDENQGKEYSPAYIAEWLKLVIAEADAGLKQKYPLDGIGGITGLEPGITKVGTTLVVSFITKYNGEYHLIGANVGDSNAMLISEDPTKNGILFPEDNLLTSFQPFGDNGQALSESELLSFQKIVGNFSESTPTTQDGKLMNGTENAFIERIMQNIQAVRVPYNNQDPFGVYAILNNIIDGTITSPRQFLNSVANPNFRRVVTAEIGSSGVTCSPHIDSIKLPDGLVKIVHVSDGIRDNKNDIEIDEIIRQREAAEGVQYFQQIFGTDQRGAEGMKKPDNYSIVMQVLQPIATAQPMVDLTQTFRQNSLTLNNITSGQSVASSPRRAAQSIPATSLGSSVQEQTPTASQQIPSPLQIPLFNQSVTPIRIAMPDGTRPYGGVKRTLPDRVVFNVRGQEIVIMTNDPRYRQTLEANGLLTPPVAERKPAPTTSNVPAPRIIPQFSSGRTILIPGGKGTMLKAKVIMAGERALQYQVGTGKPIYLPKETPGYAEILRANSIPVQTPTPSEYFVRNSQIQIPVAAGQRPLTATVLNANAQQLTYQVVDSSNTSRVITVPRQSQDGTDASYRRLLDLNPPVITEKFQANTIIRVPRPATSQRPAKIVNARIVQMNNDLIVVSFNDEDGQGTKAKTFPVRTEEGLIDEDFMAVWNANPRA